MAEPGRPERLYHYQPFDLERLSKIILEKELYFSNPGDFNDPWDCKPWFNADVMTDLDLFEDHLSWFIAVHRKYFPDLSETEIQRRANDVRSDPKLLREMIERVSEDMETTINEVYRVYCLSSKPDSELMWAHYSSKHQGICLEFDARNELFGQVSKLSYLEKFPLLNLIAESEHENLKPLITKSAAWSYEDEYRLIAQEENSVMSDGALTTKNNYLGLPDGVLTAIILGCETPYPIACDIKELIDQSTYPIKLKRAARARDRYELSIGCI
ncbi:MAG: DUF2971 domain-containing protein [Rhodospirillaceae bacterium]|nr:DUF2971 domain-containing protein [Rhodospirillaceae bacterium]